jgi:dihydropyrimidinase
MPTVLIQNGTVVNADSTVRADVLIEAGIIKEVRPGIPANSVQTVVDATGLLLLPGGIDAHTHLDMPFGGTNSADDFLTGTRAAAIGGTTTIVDFAIQARGTKMRNALDTWWKKAEGKACIDYGLHMIVTDLGDAGLEDMDDMVREGVASFKLFMAYPNVLMVDDATIFKAMRQTAKNGALICMHAENGSVIDVIVQQALAEGKTAPIYHALTRPTRAEAEAVHRAIALAEMAGVPVYIVHLSSEDALNQVREARDRGLPAFAETCPQYLLLSLEDVADKGWEGAKYVFTPPLREKKNQPKLWEGLRRDNLQVVSTDHCPFCFEDQKALGKDDFTKIPNGGPGHRESPATAASSRRGQRQFLAEPLRRARFDRAGAHLRHVSKERRARGGQRRGHRPVGSDSCVHHQRRHAPHARRLLHVRRLQGARQCARRLFARRVDCFQGRVHRQARPRQYLRREARGGAWK